MSGAYGTYGGKGGAYGDLVRKPERKKPLGRHRHRREDSIIMDLSGNGMVGTEGIDLAEDRGR